jgi:antitoxin (DNA-binding transcriptional repressor) of toxin-antitoxin stability system
VKATLAQRRRDTAKMVRPVIQGGEKRTLTENGQPCAEMIPLRRIDRRAACLDLMAIGPVEFLPRKKTKKPPPGLAANRRQIGGWKFAALFLSNIDLRRVARYPAGRQPGCANHRPKPGSS